jgi:hypothetical protein
MSGGPTVEKLWKARERMGPDGPSAPQTSAAANCGATGTAYATPTGHFRHYPDSAGHSVADKYHVGGLHGAIGPAFDLALFPLDV